LRLGEERLALCGHTDGIGAAVEQRNAEPVLQLSDAAAQPRLGDVALVGRARETLRRCQAQEVFEPLQFHDGLFSRYPGAATSRGGPSFRCKRRATRWFTADSPQVGRQRAWGDNPRKVHIGDGLWLGVVRNDHSLPRRAFGATLVFTVLLAPRRFFRSRTRELLDETFPFLRSQLIDRALVKISSTNDLDGTIGVLTALGRAPLLAASTIR